MELVRWTNTIKEFLPRCCYKFARDISASVKAVDVKLKPSYMFDLAFVPSQRIIAWLKRLHDVRLVHSQLSVITVEQQTFIVNRSTVKHRLTAITCENEQVMIVDVSAYLQQPQPASTMIVQYTAQVVAEKLTTWNMDNAFALELSADVNRTTVYGLLLGYPVVYWYSDIASADNCLSHVPLRLFRISAVDSAADSQPTVIYSFTVPEQLYSHCQLMIDNWHSQLFTLAARLSVSLYADCEITAQSVVCM